MVELVILGTAAVLAIAGYEKLKEDNNIVKCPDKDCDNGTLRIVDRRHDGSCKVGTRQCPTCNGHGKVRLVKK
jgi:hypothetical protein